MHISSNTMKITVIWYHKKKITLFRNQTQSHRRLGSTNREFKIAFIKKFDELQKNLERKFNEFKNKINK